MGREVRKVPADWRHPVGAKGGFVALHDGSWKKRAARWDEENAQWQLGLRDDWKGGWVPHGKGDMPFAEWDGPRPEEKDFMPDWPEEQRTHLMMYETTSEGTPISPAFATPEELARWLADTGASAFGDQGATYEGWLRVAQGNHALSMVILGGGMMSGVDAMVELQKEKEPA